MLHTVVDRNNKVLSVVKANATLENTTDGVDCDISELKNSDHLVIIGGTNDIDINSELNIRHYVNKIAHKFEHTNLILCTILLKYDKLHLNKILEK